MCSERRYEIIVYWSIEDDAFIAEVPELDGCMADGQTYVEAVQNAEIAIDEWKEGVPSFFHAETASFCGDPLLEIRFVNIPTNFLNKL